MWTLTSAHAKVALTLTLGGILVFRAASKRYFFKCASKPVSSASMQPQPHTIAWSVTKWYGSTRIEWLLRCGCGFNEYLDCCSCRIWRILKILNNKGPQVNKYSAHLCLSFSLYALRTCRIGSSPQSPQSPRILSHGEIFQMAASGVNEDLSEENREQHLSKTVQG